MTLRNRYGTPIDHRRWSTIDFDFGRVNARLELHPVGWEHFEADPEPAPSSSYPDLEHSGHPRERCDLLMTFLEGGVFPDAADKHQPKDLPSQLDNGDILPLPLGTFMSRRPS